MVASTEYVLAISSIRTKVVLQSAITLKTISVSGVVDTFNAASLPIMQVTGKSNVQLIEVTR